MIKEILKQKRIDSEADYKVYKMIKAQFEPTQHPDLTLHSRNDNINEMIDEALEYLKITQIT